MKKFCTDIYIWILKPIFIILISIPLVTLGLPIIIVGASTILFIMFLIIYSNKLYLIRKLKPLIQEAQKIYNINIIDNEYITFYKGNTFTSIPIPSSPKNRARVVNIFKENVGSIDSPEFIHNRNNYSAILKLKEKKGNIFFYPLANDKKFLKDIHLYDLKSLDKYEFNSILSLNITPYQKAIIYNKYLK